MMSRTTGFIFISGGIVLSAAVSHLFFWYAWVSVWCFFAAMLSVYLCYSFYGMPVLQARGATLREDADCDGGERPPSPACP